MAVATRISRRPPTYEKYAQKAPRRVRAPMRLSGDCSLNGVPLPAALSAWSRTGPSDQQPPRLTQGSTTRIRDQSTPAARSNTYLPL